MLFSLFFPAPFFCPRNSKRLKFVVGFIGVNQLAGVLMNMTRFPVDQLVRYAANERNGMPKPSKAGVEVQNSTVWWRSFKEVTIICLGLND